jgi:hypothetical protein
MSIAASIKSLVSGARSKIASTTAGRKLFGGTFESGIFGDSLYQRHRPTTATSPFFSQLRNSKGLGTMAAGYGIYKGSQSIGEEIDVANERSGRGSAYGTIVKGAGMVTGGAMGLVGATKMVGQQARILGNTFDTEKYKTLHALNRQEVQRINRMGAALSPAEKSALARGEKGAYEKATKTLASRKEAIDKELKSPEYEEFRRSDKSVRDSSAAHKERAEKGVHRGGASSKSSREDVAKGGTREDVRRRGRKPDEPEGPFRTDEPTGTPKGTREHRRQVERDNAKRRKHAEREAESKRLAPVGEKLGRLEARRDKIVKALGAAGDSGPSATGKMGTEFPKDLREINIGAKSLNYARMTPGNVAKMTELPEEPGRTPTIFDTIDTAKGKVKASDLDMDKIVQSEIAGVEKELGETVAKTTERHTAKISKAEEAVVKARADLAAPPPPPPAPAGPFPEIATPAPPLPPTIAASPAKAVDDAILGVGKAKEDFAGEIKMDHAIAAGRKERLAASAPERLKLFTKTEKPISKYDRFGDMVEGLPKKALEMAVPAVADAGLGVAAAPIAPFMLMKHGFANSNYVGSAIFGMGLYAGAGSAMAGGAMLSNQPRDRAALGGTAVFDPNAGGRPRRSGMDPSVSNTAGLVQSLHRMR